MKNEQLHKLLAIKRQVRGKVGEVATRAGVSEVSVYKVLRNETVLADTFQRVIAAAKEVAAEVEAKRNQEKANAI